MKSSWGSVTRHSCSTVRPPTPESKTPIGRVSMGRSLGAKMDDRYLHDVLDGENRVSRRCKWLTCTGHKRSAITQIANGRERQYRVVLARPRTRCKASGLAPIGSDLRLRRSRTETMVRSRSHPGRLTSNRSQRPGSREIPIVHLRSVDPDQRLKVGATEDVVRLLRPQQDRCLLTSGEKRAVPGHEP